MGSITDESSSGRRHEGRRITVWSRVAAFLRVLLVLGCGLLGCACEPTLEEELDSVRSGIAACPETEPQLGGEVREDVAEFVGNNTNLGVENDGVARFCQGGDPPLSVYFSGQPRVDLTQCLNAFCDALDTNQTLATKLTEYLAEPVTHESKNRHPVIWLTVGITLMLWAVAGVRRRKGSGHCLVRVLTVCSLALGLTLLLFRVFETEACAVLWLVLIPLVGFWAYRTLKTSPALLAMSTVFGVAAWLVRARLSVGPSGLLACVLIFRCSFSSTMGVIDSGENAGQAKGSSRASCCVRGE